MSQQNQIKIQNGIVSTLSSNITSINANSGLGKVININADKIKVNDMIVSKSIEYSDSASQVFSSNGEFVEINNKGITSKINDNKNALVMLETIKNLLIKANYFTEKEFNKEYNEIEQQISLRIDGYKVANKLIEN